MPAVVLLLGSNIEPEKYTLRAIRLVRKLFDVQGVSVAWETVAVGSVGPNFINVAIKIQTGASPAQLKAECLRRIEEHLGRVRNSDKNAPRTMDLDIVLVDGAVLDPALWQRAHIALPVSELYPALQHPESGITLLEIAQQLMSNAGAKRRLDIQIA